MHVAQVLTNETCNQNCAFCIARRPTERSAVAAAAAVLGRIDAALAAGAREIVLTGGEPTLRRDLPRLVLHAKRSGAEICVLETNGALLDDAAAGALARAGLDRARVHVPVWGGAADAVSRDEGGFDRTLAGMRALAQAGVELEIAAPVVRANVTSLPELPAAIMASGVVVRVLVLGVPVSAPDETTLVPLLEAARVIEAVDTAARHARLGLRLDPGTMVPPCLMERPQRVAHLFSMTRGGATSPDRVHVEACGRCIVREQCPGLPRAALAREKGLVVRPIADDRTRRRLSMVSTVEEQIARELVTRDIQRRKDGTTVRENIVRVNFHCNQACRFCFVSTHLPPAEDAAIEAAIRETAAVRGVLTLSGGEPTLNPRLGELVRLGLGLGVRQVELQTNAVRLADPALAQELAEAGVGLAFVSLHASNAELSDRITDAPGTFDKTVLGIDQIVKTTMRARLNFVFCEANMADFPAYVAMVAGRWPGVEITVSFVAASTDLVPLDREMIPRFSDVMPHLAEGVRRARELGVVLTGFESMCGVPLCQIPDDVSSFFDLAEAPPDRGEFLKAPVCASCALERRCFGIRRGYAALHGVEELRAVSVTA